MTTDVLSKAPTSEAIQENIDTRQLLAVIHQFVAASQESEGTPNITLDTSISQELGLDSLLRMELIANLESQFSVYIAEESALTADTPRAILQAMRHVKTDKPAVLMPTVASLTDGKQLQQTIPDNLTTLNQVLAWHAAYNPDKVHVLFLDKHRNETLYTYKALYKDAQSIAAGLLESGLKANEQVVIMLPVSIEYLHVFCGILLAGGVPVPIYPPTRPQQLEEHLRRHTKILNNAQASILVTFDDAKAIARLLAHQVKELRQVVIVQQLQACRVAVNREALVVADSIAFLQYTSGSTGQPKGVVLSHANVLASIRSMGRAMHISMDDVFISWLPLYHDMGLIGAWLGSLYHGIKLVLMSPLTFLHHPGRWLEAITTYRGTLSGAPNFAYQLCLHRISEDLLNTLDLSSWRVAFNGAEPIQATTMEMFAERFNRCNLQKNALTAVYGLAEATLGVTIPPLSRGLCLDRINPETFATLRRAEPQDSDGAMVQVSCGIPIPGFEVRIANDNGDEVADRQVGQVQFCGPAATRGYFRNPEATKSLFDNKWVRTGDQGYIADSELYITGRDKDVIIRAGRNIYPYDLEAEVGGIDGVRNGCVAVFGATETQHGKELLIVIAEIKQHDHQSRQRIKQSIARVTSELLNLTADAICLVAPYTVLKTSSGKIRRSAMRDLYHRGVLERARPAVWLQILRLQLAGLRSGIGKKLSRLGELVNLAWVTFCSVIVMGVVALITMLPLSLQQHWRVGSTALRWLLRLAGIRIRTSGIKHLNTMQPKVLVINHSSDVDAVILAAVSPYPIAFLAKQQLRDKPLVGRILECAGIRFVQRESTRDSVHSVETLVALLNNGRTVGIFPEGTHCRMPGLLPFRLGAFLAAARANVTVVTITICGSRNILRSTSWIIRRGWVQLHIDDPIEANPQETPMQRALALRKQARAQILANCGELDLSDRHDVFNAVIMQDP